MGKNNRKVNWGLSVNTRENYRDFADYYYSSARTLITSGQGISGGILMALSVEQYLKLKLYELDQAEEIKDLKHNIPKLFLKLQGIEYSDKPPLQSYDHYKDILTRLNDCFQNKYYDESGILRALDDNNGSISLGLSIFDLDILDELCYEIRSALFLLKSGHIENLIDVDNDSEEAVKFRHKNNQLENFKQVMEANRKTLHFSAGLF